MSQRKRAARTPVLVSSMVILASIAGCGGVWNVQNVLLADQIFPSQPEKHPIEIFTAGVARPHVEIARIDVSERPVHNLSLKGHSTEAAVEQLRIRARQLGADAVKNVTIGVGAPGTIGAGSVSVSGVAIRWK